MAQFLYDLYNSQYFGVIAIIWLSIDLGWIGRWQALIKRIGQLISKPWIFEEDPNPDEPSMLYPRRFLEQFALISKKRSKKEDEAKEVTKEEAKEETRSWIVSQRDNLFNPDHPIRTLGYVITLSLLVFFLIADTITIANTMVLMGLIGELSPLLQRLDLAILGGALLSAVVGIWMLIEMSGDEGELINLDRTNKTQKNIYRIIAVFVIILSVLVMVALAVQRLISLGMLDSSPTTNIILSFILYGLLAINNSFAAALTFSPAAAGLMTVIYLLVLLLIGLLPVFVALLDIIWRVAFVAVDIAVWVLFTPFIAIPYGISRIIDMFSGDGNDDEENGGKKNNGEEAKP